MKSESVEQNCAFLGSHANGILNSLLSHLNGSSHQTATPNFGRTFYDEASTTAKLEYQLRETEQLLEISLLKKKLRETERAMEQIIADIHGKAAKCNSDDDENNASNNTNDTTMNVTTTQVRSSKFLLNQVDKHTQSKTDFFPYQNHTEVARISRSREMRFLIAKNNTN